MPVAALSFVPNLLALHAGDTERFPVLLESVGDTGWDILLAYPSTRDKFTLADAQTFFDQLPTLDVHHQYPIATNTAHLPFRGGWFVYMGYEMLHVLEPSVSVQSEGHFPDAVLMRIPAAVMHDRSSSVTWIFAENERIFAQLQQDVAQITPYSPSIAGLQSLREEDGAIYLRAVEIAKAYIQAGDVFQVNLSRRWWGNLAEGTTAQSIFYALRHYNPAPFSGIAQLDTQHAIVSSSPEYLFKTEGCHISTRPIAGTFARDSDPQQDARHRENLRAHPKERAEHIMLVDLERNDLGRVCQPGTVQVDELMGVSTYAYVHHIESVVSGELRAEISCYDLIRALFPGGTITGCPKVRTMQIIAELETSARGAYTGSMGLLNLDGDMVMNILIRTMMVSDQTLRFSAGAGIVADSDPERELAETRAKAKGLLRALGVYSITE